MNIRTQKKALFDPKWVYDQLQNHKIEGSILKDGLLSIDVETVMSSGVLGPKTTFKVKRAPDEEPREFLTLKAAINHAYGVKP
jgi:hypothetical protein